MRDVEPAVRSVTRPGQAAKATLAKKVRWVDCEGEKGQASSVEKKGKMSEALKFAWQKARPSGCQVRGTFSTSSKEDSSQETFTANPDRVAHNSLPNLYVEPTRSWSGYCQGLRAYFLLL